MLSSKQSNIHGMRAEKWGTREKSSQIRAILRLYGRDRKLQASNDFKLKRKISRTIRELKAEIKDYRAILNDSCKGDKRLLRSLLQSQRDLQTQLRDADPSEAREVIFQDYNLRKKQLDKILNCKSKHRGDICKLKTELAELEGVIEPKPDVAQAMRLRRQQVLITRYQVALAKRHAADSISDTYKQILVILRKDSKYFDGVLNALREDRRSQSKIIYKTALMGQLATENLDDIRQKYKRMAHDVWVNMKEREKDLENAKMRAEDVWEYAKSLVRVESDANLAKKKQNLVSPMDRKLEAQIKRLEQIFNSMKDSMMIRSYEELFLRLEDQVNQRQRLTKLHERTMKERDLALNKKNHAETMLENLKNSMLTTTTRYKTEKAAMFEKIKEEQKREEKYKQTIEYRAALIMKIKGALQNMVSMLICIKGVKSLGKKDKRAMKDEEKEKEEEKGKEKNVCEEVVEDNGVLLLQEVTKKAVALFGSTNIELNPARMRKATDMYETYISSYQSHLKFGEGAPEATGIIFEHEAVDADVLTRADIKTKSKQVVEAHTREE